MTRVTVLWLPLVRALQVVLILTPGKDAMAERPGVVPAFGGLAHLEDYLVVVRRFHTSAQHVTWTWIAAAFPAFATSAASPRARPPLLSPQPRQEQTRKPGRCRYPSPG